MLANVLFLPEAFSGRPAGRCTSMFLDTLIVDELLGTQRSHIRAPGRGAARIASPGGRTPDFRPAHPARGRGWSGRLAATHRTAACRSITFLATSSTNFATVGFNPQRCGRRPDRRLGDRLRENEIDVRGDPDDTADLTLDERELEVALKEGVNYNRHGTMVEGSRFGQSRRSSSSPNGLNRRHIESCDAVVVNDQPQACPCKSRLFLPTFWPSCRFHRHSMTSAAIAWLMNPAQAADPPRRQIVAIPATPRSTAGRTFGGSIYVNKIRRHAREGHRLRSR